MYLLSEHSFHNTIVKLKRQFNHYSYKEGSLRDYSKVDSIETELFPYSSVSVKMSRKLFYSTIFPLLVRKISLLYFIINTVLLICSMDFKGNFYF